MKVDSVRSNDKTYLESGNLYLNSNNAQQLGGAARGASAGEPSHPAWYLRFQQPGALDEWQYVNYPVSTAAPDQH